jgi:hypothetical protein
MQAGALAAALARAPACMVCLAPLAADVAELPCGHVLCGADLDAWLAARAARGEAPTCPMCRSVFAPRRVARSARDAAAQS